MEEKAQKLLDYWFEGIESSTAIESGSDTVKKWFMKNADVDNHIRQNFEGDLIRARKGKYEKWLQTPEETLALVIIFDQLPRNLYRDMPEAFDNDLRALEICLNAIKKKQDKKLTLIQRQFLYLPLMHSESLAIQEKSLEYFNLLVESAEKKQKRNIEYFTFVYGFAKKHYDIISRFGRYPHRNEILNRRSTPEEEAFLQEDGSSF